ncbi:MAG: thioredoxin domain-containing protein [Gemmatimonadota bacterium]
MGPARRAAALLASLAVVLVAAACKDTNVGAQDGAKAVGGDSAARVSAAASSDGAPMSGVPASGVSPAGVSADTLSDSLLMVRADRGRLMGQESAPIWVVIISDFQCPYCKMWHDSTMTGLTRDYVNTGKVRLAYLNLPLAQHPHARAEADASLCAGVQGKFWPYADGLFHRQADVARMASVEGLLDSLGRAQALDMTEFARCRKSKAIRQLVNSDIQQADGSGARSTPTILVGSFIIQGVTPYKDFRKAVDTALFVARNAAKGKR